MNREHLFKGRNVENGDWVEGGYVSKIDANQYRAIVRHYIIDEETSEFIEVYKDSVCEYTGFKDESKTKIWENDYISFMDKTSDGKTFVNEALVIFHNGMWMLDEFEIRDSYVRTQMLTDPTSFSKIWENCYKLCNKVSR